MRTILVTTVVAVTLAACGGKARPTGTPTSAQGSVAIVAGENFWGSIVKQLAGSVGRVTSVVTDPNADPHTYEASVDTARSFADARYVVLNGAGYDGWAEKLISGNPNAQRRVLTIADILGKKEGDNPHFWYDPAYVLQVADRVTADLKVIDPADATYLDGQRVTFSANMRPVLDEIAAIKRAHAGAPVASTESIFVYMAAALGLDLRSPAVFMQAVAEGNDPPAPSVAAFQDLISNRQVRLLVYNQQTSTDVTTTLKGQAKAKGIPVVGITETIVPPTAEYEPWMLGQLQKIQAALG